MDLTREDVQRVLDENTELIKKIIHYQSEGLINESSILENKLHSNFALLSKFSGNGREIDLMNLKDQKDQENLQLNAILSRFIRAVNEIGFSDLDNLSEATDIPKNKLVLLGLSYIEMLKRQNRFSEAQIFEKELAINGVESNK